MQASAALQRPASMRMRLVGANARPEVKGLEPVACPVNYFVGNDPKKWHTDVPQYSRVKYDAVYPGVDLVYYGTQGQLEYDLVVAPGADPDQIRLAYEGAENVTLNSAGDLLLRVGESTVRQHRPVVYQDVGGKRRTIEASYVVEPAAPSHPAAGRAPTTVRVALGDYDRARTLVIDPILAYSSYLGGGGIGYGFGPEDAAYSIAVDQYGFVYVTGVTLSPTFPLHNQYSGDQNQWDVFVTKLDPHSSAGSLPLRYSSYFGGNYSEQGNGIAVDDDGSAFVTGYTTSSNFPLLGAYQTVRKGNLDVFVMRVDTNLSGLSSLRYSTLLGGNADDVGSGIATDASSGFAYVTGSTQGGLPVKNACQPAFGGSFSDAFLAKIDTNAVGAASLSYLTYLGGNDVDYGNGVAADASGHAYVAGSTVSFDFVTTPGAYSIAKGCLDAFVVMLDTNLTAAASRVYNTRVGGNHYDMANAIAVDPSGNAYITGMTDSINFPVEGGYPGAVPVVAGAWDAFLTKLNPSGTAVPYSTRFAGNGQESGMGVAVDAAGNAYVTGNTASTDFPTQDPLFVDMPGADAFVAMVNTNAIGTASLVWSTYLGGGSTDAAAGIAVDQSGSAYVTGYTASLDYPTVDAYQGDQPGMDAFITKISPLPPPSPVSLTTGAYGGLENERFAMVTAMRTGDLSAAASVTYATSDGTALAASDYTAMSGVISFGSGQSSATVAVPLVDDWNLEPNETFSFTLGSPSGATLVSPSAAIVTIGDDIYAPSPETVRFVVASPTAINVSWQDRCTNETGFEVRYSTSSANGPWLGSPSLRGPSSPASQTGATLTKQVNIGLVPGSDYYFQVIAVKGALASAAAVGGPVLLGAPAPPVSLSVVAQSCATIKLQYTDNSNDEQGFHIYRSLTGVPGSYSLVLTRGASPDVSSVLTSTDTSLTPNTTYYYEVTAFNGAVPADSPPVAVSGTTLAVPTAPVNLTATVNSSTSVKLTWTDTAGTEEGFQIESSTTGLPGSFAYLPPAVALSAGSGLLKTKIVSGLTHGTTYWFRVRAYNSGYFSGYTNEASATP
jgi:hypothetical protein